jgi:hypothetical protein
VPRDVALELRFDQYVLPSTAVRQSVRLYSGNPAGVLFLEPEHDVVERVVRYSLPTGVTLQPGLLYTIELIAPSRTQPLGFRTLENAPLEAGDLPLTWSFFTARAEPAPGEEEDRSTASCADLVRVFDETGCTLAGCHGADEPAMGLRLDSERSIAETALRRVAHETEIGPRLSTPQVDSHRFGVALPIIDPGNPGNSYLLYKLLVNPRNFGSEHEQCSTRFRAPTNGTCLPPSGDERRRLLEGFVLLDPMPPAPYSLGSLEDLRTLQRALRNAAGLEACGAGG